LVHFRVKCGSKDHYQGSAQPEYHIEKARQRLVWPWFDVVYFAAAQEEK